MAWQLLAIFAIVTATVIWLIRDERRSRAQTRLANAARYYAHAPRQHFGTRNLPPQDAPPRPRSGSLLRNDRAYFDQLLSQRANRNSPVVRTWRAAPPTKR